MKMLYTEYYVPYTNFRCGSITYLHNTYRKNHSEFKKKNKISLGSKKQAFAKAGRLLYFNPDLHNFVTLTYAEGTKDYQKVYNDFRNFLKDERKSFPDFKYMAVFEHHESGDIHIHMICNRIQKNPKGSEHNVKNWTHGYSTAWTVSQMTYYHRKHSKNKKKFEPLKYLFNYMKKNNDKIGGRWILKSKNLVRPLKHSENLGFKSFLKTMRHLSKKGYKIEKKTIYIESSSPQLCVELPIYSFFFPRANIHVCPTSPPTI